jgi:anaerobic ribonucleoside-triphosphate reductase
MLTNLRLCWECGALRPIGDDPCPHCSWREKSWTRRIGHALHSVAPTCLSSTAVRAHRTARDLIPTEEVAWGNLLSR